MGTLIVVDCEAPFGVGAPSVGDMTEFGAVDVNALRDGRVETFHGTDCSEDTFRRFREWLDPRMPVVFVSDNPAYDFQWINFYSWRYCGMNPFGHSGRRIADYYAGLTGDFSKHSEMEAFASDKARSPPRARRARERRGADSNLRRRTMRDGPAPERCDQASVSKPMFALVFTN